MAAKTEADKQKMREWRLKNREHISAYNKAYKSGNKEAVLERHRKWRIKNRDKIREYAKNTAYKYKERIDRYSKRWVAENREKLQVYRKEYGLKVKYGMDLKQYAKMLYDQKEVCAICEQKETRQLKGKLQSLAVDHDHRTGKVRGLLCCSCNRAIGMFRESLQVIKRAVLYMERNKDE